MIHGQFYSIEVYYRKTKKHTKKATFIDSLKIIPFSVEQIAKTFRIRYFKIKN